ncbi:MAG: methyl-accepting chemotaxis protein, partial [Treponema sp.]|nr:methyl-accepting chemotaxis protein [Treponema sp.]
LLAEEGSPVEFENYMRELVGQFGIYNSIIILNSRGTIIASTSGSTGGERADRDYFRSSIAGRSFISQVEVSRQTGALSLFASIPIRNHAGEIFGVAMTSIKVEALNQMYVVPVNLLGDKGYAMLVNGAGMVIGHRNNELLGSSVSDEIRQQLASVQESSSFQAEVDGRDSMFFVQKSKYTDWYSIVVCPIDDFYTATTRLLEINLILGGLVIIILGIAISFIILKTTKPISNVANTLKDISQGEGNLTGVIPENGNDEISRMSHYFNETTKKIRGMIISIIGETRALSETGSDLADDMTQTKSAMNDIYSNIVGIKSRMINQSASVAETNATMEQITGNINKLNNYVEKQASSVSLSSSAIQQMLSNVEMVTQTLVKNGENVGELTGASEVGRAGLLNVVSDIREIAKESEGLLEINAVMENIASQTNLLSMNAAIEAAHAGETGRGFAVVAGEIRKLAESSSAQSKMISDVLKKIKGSIDKITSSTDKVLQNFEAIDSKVKTVAEQEENIRHAMEEQNEGNKQILEAIVSVNETTQMVKNVTQEMLVGAKEVIEEAGSLEKATAEITNGVNEMSSGAEHINTAMGRVNDLSLRNRGYIETLMTEVSRFKV